MSGTGPRAGGLTSSAVDILLAASQSLTSTLDLVEVLQKITQHATELLGEGTGAVYLASDTTLYLGATTPALPPEFPEDLRTARLEDHPRIKQCIESGEPVFLLDAREATLTNAERQACEIRGLRSILYVPLLVGEESVGALILATTDEPRTFSDEQVRLIRMLASQAAIAVQNATLWDQSRRQRVRAEALAQFSHALAVAVRESELFQRVVEEVAEHTGVGCVLGLEGWWEHEFELVALHHLEPSTAEQLRVWGETGKGTPSLQEALQAAATSAKASLVALRPVADELADFQVEDDPGGFGWLLCVPLERIGERGGALGLFHHNEAVLNDPELRLFIAELADRAAYAVASARLYEELELRVEERTQALKTSEERYRTLISGSPDAMLAYSEGRVIFVNPAAVKLVGATSMSQLIGMPVLDLFHPADQARLGELQRSGPHAPIDGRMRRFDGRVIDVELTVGSVSFEDQPAVQLIARDISERKRAEKRLLVQTVVAQTITTAKTLDEALRGTLQEVCRALGWLLAEIWTPTEAGSHLRCSMSWHQPAISMQRWQEQTQNLLLSTGEGVPGEVWRRREPTWWSDAQGDGTMVRTRWAEEVGLHCAVGFPIECADSLEGVLVFYGSEVLPQDDSLLLTLVTAGSALGHLAERLRAETNLREAKAEAERANHAKSDFLSKMSHELRTPLNAILGFSELLSSDPLTQEQSKRVQLIRQSGHHLLNLINEVLDLSSIEAGTATCELTPVDIRGAIQRAVDLIHPLATQRELSLTVDLLGPSKLFVSADPQHLHQVLLNLLSNAVKYNRVGGAITVSLSMVDGGRLRIAVTDTGRGIEPLMLPRLFRAFERLDQRTSFQPGTGLGLALSRGLTEAMGGTLGVESRVGEGSTFWLELDLDTGGGEESTDASSSAASRLLTAGSGVVMQVEDDPVNIALMQAIFNRFPNAELVVVQHGEAVVETARSCLPKLILLDLHLPDMHGSDVLRALREEPLTREIPVVIVSADASRRPTQQLLSEGAQGYLTKPIDIRELTKLVQRMLD